MVEGLPSTFPPPRTPTWAPHGYSDFRCTLWRAIVSRAYVGDRCMSIWHRFWSHLGPHMGPFWRPFWASNRFQHPFHVEWKYFTKMDKRYHTGTIFTHRSASNFVCLRDDFGCFRHLFWQVVFAWLSRGILETIFCKNDDFWPPTWRPTWAGNRYHLKPAPSFLSLGLDHTTKHIFGPHLGPFLDRFEAICL